MYFIKSEGYALERRIEADLKIVREPPVIFDNPLTY
jgi:hypothetical protein